MAFLERTHRLVGRVVDGKPIWAFDWDICCILDGCRVDTLRKFYPDADSYVSVESSSQQWLAETFAGRDNSDVAYLSANPFAEDYGFGYFHQEPIQEIDGIETVPPRELTHHAVSLWRSRTGFDIDQLIIHYMQPHVPFRSTPSYFDEFYGTDTWGACVWERVGGEIDADAWFRAYEDNLQWVLTDGVQPLAELVNAKIGVTADHGNACGEWGISGHPHGVAVPAVRNVPWRLIQGERQHDNFESVELGNNTLSTEQRQGQLAALGYR